MSCVGYCPYEGGCGYSCALEQEMLEEAERQAMETEHYRQMEAEHYREQERLYWLEREGGCASHLTHEPTCEECIAWCRHIGLLQA